MQDSVTLTLVDISLSSFIAELDPLRRRRRKVPSVDLEEVLKGRHDAYVDRNSLSCATIVDISPLG